MILEPLEVTAAREHAVPPPGATINLTGAVLEHTPSSSPYDMFRRAVAVDFGHDAAADEHSLGPIDVVVE